MFSAVLIRFTFRKIDPYGHSKKFLTKFFKIWRKIQLLKAWDKIHSRFIDDFLFESSIVTNTICKHDLLIHRPCVHFWIDSIILRSLWLLIAVNCQIIHEKNFFFELLMLHRRLGTPFISFLQVALTSSILNSKRHFFGK